jgi:hypothetical protein
MVLRDYNGFESIPYVFAHWTARGDSLFFEGLLNYCVPVGMATLQIDEVLSLSSNESLVKGSAAGGDAGDINGTLWIAYWRRQTEFTLIYRKDWYRESHEPDVEVRLIHDLDRETLLLKVELQERRVLEQRVLKNSMGERHAREYSAWRNRAVEIVDLGALVRSKGDDKH